MHLGSGTEGLGGGDNTVFFLTARCTGWDCGGSLGLSWRDLSFILSLVSVHPDSEVHPPTENPG